MTDNQKQQQQVVVWEGEWMPMRLVARKMVEFFGLAKTTTVQLKETAKEQLAEANVRSYERIESAKVTASSVYQDYPLLVVAGTAALFSVLTRRFQSRMRLTAIGTIVTSGLILYPNHAATLLTDPGAYVDSLKQQFKQ